MEIKKLVVAAVASLGLLGMGMSFADTCPGTDGVFNYSGTLPDQWDNSTQETISNGEHNFLQVTWKNADGSAKGGIYCTYSGSLVLANKNTSIERPTGENWKPSSVANAYNCMKSSKDCEFTVPAPAPLD